MSLARTNHFSALASQPGTCSLQQRGQGTLEFALAVVPVMLLALGGIEATHWFWARQSVSQALMQAARAGTTAHANPRAIAQAFNASMQLAFPAQGSNSSLERQQQRYAQHTTDLGAPWHMQVLSPLPEHFVRYADHSLPVARRTGYPAIRNAYQLEQHQRQHQHNKPEAPSEQHEAPDTSIFQANVLSLRVVYPTSPLLPGMRQLFMALGSTTGSTTRRTLAAGYLPVVEEISLPMQSDPVQWPAGSVAGFFPAQPENNAKFGIRPGRHNANCQGMWCTGNHLAHASTGVGHETVPNTLLTQPAIGTDTAVPVGGEPLVIPADSPQCGINVCCL